MNPRTPIGRVRLNLKNYNCKRANPHKNFTLYQGQKLLSTLIIDYQKPITEECLKRIPWRVTLLVQVPILHVDQGSESRHSQGGEACRDHQPDVRASVRLALGRIHLTDGRDGRAGQNQDGTKAVTF